MSKQETLILNTKDGEVHVPVTKKELDRFRRMQISESKYVDRVSRQHTDRLTPISTALASTMNELLQRASK